MDCHHGEDRQLIDKKKHRKHKSNEKVIKSSKT